MTLKRETSVYQKIGYLFILPAFFLIAVFQLYPLVRNLVLSFYSWDMVTSAPRFLGLGNYRELLADENFYQSLKVTVLYSLGFVPVSMAMGLGLSVLMTKKSRMNVLYRTVFFSPTVTSMVAMSAVWMFIYHPQYGSLNTLLGLFGMEPVRWLNSPDTALLSLVIMNIWKRFGFCTVVYLSALLNVSGEIQEAATIDGASSFQIFWRIKLPMVSPSTFMLVIMMTIESFQVFTQINVMTGGGPNFSTTNLVTYLYKQAFDQFRVGYGSAIAVVLLAVILLVNLIQMRFEKYVHYDA
jgi:multiple sugar transport system permease protein